MKKIAWLVIICTTSFTMESFATAIDTGTPVSTTGTIINTGNSGTTESTTESYGSTNTVTQEIVNNDAAKVRVDRDVIKRDQQLVLQSPNSAERWAAQNQMNIDTTQLQVDLAKLLADQNALKDVGDDTDPRGR